MRNLINIYAKLKPGDIVLFQQEFEYRKFTKPELAVIVGIDFWDMACSVHYVKYKDFDAFGKGTPEVYSFGEWMQFWNVLGHWKSMPKFKTLLKAYRKLQPWTQKEHLTCNI